jgi:predicted aldo/keto reductase-like oxidoreductase
MMEGVASNCGKMPHSSSADAGYFSEANAEWALNQGINAHIATGRRKHDEPARKLATKAGAKVYSRRKVIAEPPFGQIKAARGFRQFLLRSLAKVRGEWSLITLTHNLLKLHSVHPRLALT